VRKLKIFFTITTFSALSFGITAEVYQVQRKDSLIKIIRNRFPDLKVFGKKGILKEVLALNPSIKNPNLIYVNQRISLPEKYPRKEVTSNSPKLSIEKEIANDTNLSNTRAISFDSNTIDQWVIKVLYGANFMSLEQSKTLTGYSLNSLSSNHLKFESEFEYYDYKLLASHSSYTMSISSETRTHEKKLSNFELQGVISNYLFGISYRESPLIKATTTSLELNKEGQLGIILGYDKTWLLPTTKPTTIDFKNTIFIPLKNSSDSTITTLKSIKGFGVNSQLEISRAIIKKEDLSLDIIWQNGVSYESTSRSTTWGSSSGSVNLSKIGLFSIIGLGIRF
jgi:hypothetical protein